jgi:hypothetical protein
VELEFGGRSKRSEKKLRNKKIVEVNFRSTAYFSQKTDNNENNNSLTKKVIIVKFQELPSLMFPILK